VRQCRGSGRRPSEARNVRDSGENALVGRLIDRPADAAETILRTLAMFGPLMVFRRARGAALLALGWSDFAGERLALVKAVLWDQAVGALGLRPDPPNVAPRARRR